MRIVTTYHAPGPRGRYDIGRMVAAYKRSAAAAGLPLEAVEVPVPPIEQIGLRRAETEFRYKIAYWLEIVKQASEPIVFTDSDMLIFNDPRRAFEATQWDLAVTVRTGQPPLNAGALFVRPTDAAIEFMQAWIDEMHAIIERRGHTKWLQLFGAIDQAALAQLMIDTPRGVRVGQLPCSIYNCADAEWPQFDADRTCLLHVKGRLRLACLGQPAKRDTPPAQQRAINKLSALWRTFDQSGDQA